MKPYRLQDFLLWLLPIPFLIWLALLFAPCLGGNLLSILDSLTCALKKPFSVTWTDRSLKIILLFLLIYAGAAGMYLSSRPKLREGEEHGSARWGSTKELNRMISQSESFPLTKHVRLGMDTHLHRRNLNILVLGGSGAGKTRSLALPNIMEVNCSYVITDPKWTVFKDNKNVVLFNSGFSQILMKPERQKSPKNRQKFEFSYVSEERGPSQL